MNILACPHCATHVKNDGTLASQIVSCPNCRGRFQMPPAEADTSTLKRDLRDLKKRRMRVTFQEWSEGRFSWIKEVTAEPFLFRLLTFAGVFLRSR